jgi:hypothetical protein
MSSRAPSLVCRSEDEKIVSHFPCIEEDCFHFCSRLHYTHLNVSCWKGVDYSDVWTNTGKSFSNKGVIGALPQSLHSCCRTVKVSVGNQVKYTAKGRGRRNDPVFDEVQISHAFISALESSAVLSEGGRELKYLVRVLSQGMPVSTCRGRGIKPHLKATAILCVGGAGFCVVGRGGEAAREHHPGGGVGLSILQPFQGKGIHSPFCHSQPIMHVASRIGSSRSHA